MKITKILLALLMSIGFIVPVSAAEVGNNENTNVRTSACNDQILYKGSVIYFLVNAVVDAIDINRQMVYISVIGAWVPSYHLMHTTIYGNKHPDQVLDVGYFVDFFSEPTQKNYELNTFKVRDIDIPNNRALINFTDRYGNIYPTWVDAGPATETCELAMY